MTARVLIVDPEENHRKTVAVGLRVEGFRVVEAVDGPSALDQLHDVDACVVDLMVPDIGGLALARQIGMQAPEIPLLVVSAYPLTPRQLARAEVQVRAFVGKPCRPEELAMAVRGALLAQRPAVAAS